MWVQMEIIWSFRSISRCEREKLVLTHHFIKSVSEPGLFTQTTWQTPPPVFSRRTKSGDFMKPCLLCVHRKLSPRVHASFLSPHKRCTHSYYSLSGSYFKHALAWAKSWSECEDEYLRFIYIGVGYVYASFTSYRLHCHQRRKTWLTYPVMEKSQWFGQKPSACE